MSQNNESPLTHEEMVTRQSKGSPLTHEEMDKNLIDLNNSISQLQKMRPKYWSLDYTNIIVPSEFTINENMEDHQYQSEWPVVVFNKNEVQDSGYIKINMQYTGMNVSQPHGWIISYIYEILDGVLIRKHPVDMGMKRSALIKNEYDKYRRLLDIGNDLSSAYSMTLQTDGVSVDSTPGGWDYKIEFPSCGVLDFDVLECNIETNFDFSSIDIWPGYSKAVEQSDSSS